MFVNVLCEAMGSKVDFLMATVMPPRVKEDPFHAGTKNTREYEQHKVILSLFLYNTWRRD